jgi:hypothetical protein
MIFNLMYEELLDSQLRNTIRTTVHNKEWKLTVPQQLKMCGREKGNSRSLNYYKESQHLEH